ncbi:MAG: FAD-dependent oxidoreductase [Armatimonadota bacterium]|nr:MAG: FAD-dependent oxidoreductase [Armatimonadota bacterium]
MQVLLEAQKREPIDVLVAGGGIAGFCASVAARRAGARVLLIEDMGCLGGNATSGGVGAFCGETRGQGEVFDDIIRHLGELDAVAPYRPYEEREARQFDHQVLAYVLQEMAAEAGVEVLLFTHAAAAVREADRVSAVILSNRSGLAAVPASVVIDATGEACVVRAAGLPVQPDGDGALPMSVMFFMREVNAPADLPPAAVDPELASDPPMISRWPEPHGKLGVKVKVVGYDAADGDSLTAAEMAGRRVAMRVANHLRAGDYAAHKFDHFSARIGIREGRRILGDYTLTEQDVRAGRRFDDGVALGRFYLDYHDPSTPRRISRFDRAAAQVPPYHIPYRCLIAQGVENVLAAGRCLSADRAALSSARVMTTCAMMGQAAGLAAAQASDGDVRSVAGAALAEALRQRGAEL